MIETKLNGTTPDIAEENIAKLKEIFPDVFCEGKVDFEKLQQVLGNYIEVEKERYDFSWNGKARSRQLAQTPSTGTLRPCKEESKDWDTTENLYIEGDNLEVLKLLQKSYHGKIKMIYIDPPYNTGHDFVYPDDYRDNMQNYLELTGQVDGEGKKISTNSEANGRYHTDWLNMMYPRLRLARNLLTDDGVIFISIDDNEVGNLRKLCDEIFGEDNFITEFIWKSKSGGANDSKHIAVDNEYIMCYTKTIEKCVFLLDKYATVTTSYNLQEPDGRKYGLDRLDKQSLGYIESLDFPIEGPDGKIYTVEHKNPNNKVARWRWGKETVKERYDELVFKYPYVYTKNYEKEGVIPRNLLLEDRFGRTRTGKTDFKILFDNISVFDFPKPINLIKYFIEILLNKNDIVLDFFSGSATTAHAIMQLNAEDGGNRKFICVQLPEPTDEKSEAYKLDYKNICEIGKERIRRAGEKINSEIIESNKQITLDGEEKKLVDVGFKVLKLDSSNIRRWNPDFDNLELALWESVDNLVEGRNELDLVYEIMIKYGLDLTYPVEELSCGDKKVYSIGFGMLVIYVAEDISLDVAKFIADYKKQNNIEEMRVVFKDSSFDSNDSLKTNTKEILKVAGVEEFITI